MLRALVEDFARLPGVEIATTWDRRCGVHPFGDLAGCTVHATSDAGSQSGLIAQLAADSTETFLIASERRRQKNRRLAPCRSLAGTVLIAPEFQGLLAEQCRIVEAAGGRLLGSSRAAVEICADKLGLALRLETGGVATIATHEFRIEAGSSDAEACELPFPVVVKPRDGAGSQSTFLVVGAEEMRKLRSTFAADPLLKHAIWQPYVAGLAVSVGLIFSDAGERAAVLPVCEQRLTADGRFQYLGGRVPFAFPGGSDAVQEAAYRACRLVAGLRGYVGVDLIIPEVGHPRVVEINPRLTTSYLGYRKLAADNLAGTILGITPPDAIVWHRGSVSFDAAGNATYCADA